MALGMNKILVASTATNAASAYFQAYSAGNATVTLPAGTYYIAPTANVTIEFNTYTSNTNSWTTWIAANTAGIIVSDGFNVRANATTGTQTVTLYTPNGGQAATQSTYASS